MPHITKSVVGLALLWATYVPAQAQQPPPAPPQVREVVRPHLADYDAELRRADGRVDIPGLIDRLKDLKVTTYYWLVYQAATDWDDLKVFLPRAAEAGIAVWVYLVPPTESAPRYGNVYPEPFRLDYLRWAEEIARLSLDHPNLTAWVIDDFYANRALFTPDYVRRLRERSGRVNPRLAFLPLMYFNDLKGPFVSNYREVIDGVVVAYLEDREEIEWTWALLNDAADTPHGELSYPPNTPSRANDFGMISQTARVLPADRYRVHVRERDDFRGTTVGYHIKQLLVDGTVVWEADVADEPAGWHTIDVDVTDQVRGKSEVTLALRLLERRGVGNFGVSWRIGEFQADHLKLAAELREPDKWRASRRGGFEAGFGGGATPGRRRFHIPFISMTAVAENEFRLRHGDPVTLERIARQLRLSLDAWRDGKCDGVVTYCLDKRAGSQFFPEARTLFRAYRQPGPR